MVSQSMGQADSPVDPWDGVSNDSCDADGLPSLLDPKHPRCQSDLRFMRHRAAWINLQSEQQPLQDLGPQGPAVGNSGSCLVGAAAFPVGRSPLSFEDSVGERSLSKDAVDSVSSSSAQGSGEKNRDFSCTPVEEQAVLPAGHPQMSLFPTSKILAPSLGPEADGALPKPSHLAAPADEGAVHVSKRVGSLNSFSAEACVLPVDVEKENAHFYVADMIISAMEKMKCNILSRQHTENWRTEEVSGALGNDQAYSEVNFHTNVKQESGSSTSSDSGYEGCAVLQVSPLADCDVTKEACKCDFDDFVIVELDEFSNNSTEESYGCSCGSSSSVIYQPNFNSAELLAKELYRVFRKCWILSEVNYQLAGSLNVAGLIVLNEDHVGKDFDSSVDVVQEIKLKSRMRGTEDWEPPRFQIIFNVHPPVKRDLMVAAQNFLCAGCGTPIEPKFVKRLRYCEYLGKYFCDCCHSYSESCVPARILKNWDFRKYYVSNFSKRLLDGIWHQPIVNLQSISHSVYAKAKELDRVKEIQEQLFHIKKLLKTCRFAESAVKEFEQVPGHLTDELHLFSLEDLVRVRKRLLMPSLKDILKTSLAHIASCELCQGKGFICEFCRSAAVIFPFQTTMCRRCSVCRACFHKQCYQSAQCPRCARITARRLLESSPSAET
ncbi:protein associated with UVRAG as autophagy enhancer [Manis javanica]|uniref:protein associated with UVRAG as autophagy enhancer n=1 Tax=Manis javanica TaxID=9974 RepID=UPI003C6D21B2